MAECLRDNFSRLDADKGSRAQLLLTSLLPSDKTIKHGCTVFIEKVCTSKGKSQERVNLHALWMLRYTLANSPVQNNSSAIIKSTFLRLRCHSKYDCLPRTATQWLPISLVECSGNTPSQVCLLLPETHYPGKGLVHAKRTKKPLNK